MHSPPLAPHSSSPVELKQQLVADRRGLPYLLYRSEEGDQRIVELSRRADRVTIGRQEACDVALPHDPSVSRVHAVLERIGDEWTLVDDGSSRNGSFVNGRRIHGRRRLCHGDLLRMGGTSIAFRDPGDRAAAETAPASAIQVPVSSAQRRVLVALCRPLAEPGFAAPPSNAEIAQALFLSVETVKSHMHALFGLFGLDDVPHQHKRAQLAAAALERGVVTFPDLTGPGA